MKKLLKITEIERFQKSHNFQTITNNIITEIEDLNEDCVKFHVSIFYTFREISRQRTLQSGWVGSGRAEPVHHFK